jgi:putative transferase (TIGR04331 family)
MKNKLLVTTAIKETWGEGGDEVVFLGDWCKEYNAENLRDKSNVVSFHMRDRDKFNKDNIYLEKFYERLLASITDALNHHHCINRSIRYWMIILGPWLLTYISALWDRWESLRVAFEENEFGETILLNDVSPIVPKNHAEAFYLIASSDLWNHMIYGKILKKHYSNSIKFRKISSYNPDVCKKFVDKSRKITRKYTVFSWIDKILSVIQKNEKFVISTSYFSIKALIRISLRLKQIPRLYSEFDRIIDNIDSSNRKIVLEINCQNKFELFVKNNVIRDMPFVYIEGYKKILDDVRYLFPHCKVIFSANSYWYNDFFKVFCAEKVSHGKKLIISDHGGAIPLSVSNFSHEDKISDIHVVWHKIFNKRQVKLPPNLIINRVKNRKKGKNLSIIGLELPMYPARHSSGTISSLTLDDYEHKLNFIDALDCVVKGHISIRLKSVGRWNIKQRYTDELGIEKISQYSTMSEEIDNSKIVVCTYAQTTFFESLYSGVPTILLYKEEYWETHSDFSALISMMKDSKIIFSDSICAANHINKVWENPKLWWDSLDIINAREEFFDQCGRVDDDWLNQWSSFFKKQIMD